MAKMLPPYLSDDIKSSAEKRVFQLLRDDPATGEWVVLHSLGLSRHAHKRYGEVDFVVLVPGGAVVCLEVKGGRIACHDGEWQTIDRYGQPHTLTHSPFDQAREGMFALQKIVENNAPDGKRLARLCSGYGVLFPDVEWTQSGPEYDDWQVFDRSFIGPISHFIKGIVRNNADAKKNYPRPTPHDVAQLRQFLRPDFEAKISPLGQMEQNESELLRLTEEQYEVLDNLDGNPRLLIEGAAGTGKTLLSLEAARRALLRGERVALLCFNRLLGRWIEERIVPLLSERPELKAHFIAGSLHRVLERDIIAHGAEKEAFVEARQRAMGTSDEGRFFREDYPLFALDALSEGATPQFDLLIVDEAQDVMTDEYLSVFDYFLKGGLAGGQWMFFGDFTRQAIFAGGQMAEEMRAQLQKRSNFATFTLKRNCRNPRRIGREAALLSGFEKLPFSLHARDGSSVDYRFYNSEGKQRKIIGELVGRLIEEYVPPSDIILLSPVRLENSCLREPVEELVRRGLSIEPLNDATLLSPPPKSVLFSTLHAFKGLERRVVIVIGIEHLSDESRQAGLYVAMSRPTARLFVLLSESARRDYDALVERGLLWQSKGWGWA